MRALEWVLNNRRVVLGTFLVVIVFTGVLLPFVGRDFFPQVDGGQIRLHLRAPAGTRLESSEQIAAKTTEIVREVIPEAEISSVISNIGLTSERYNFMFSDNSSASSADAELLISLGEERSHPTMDYVRELRARLREEMPDVTYFFLPADIVSQILNFGLTAAIDVQVSGFDRANNLKVAREMRSQNCAGSGCCGCAFTSGTGCARTISGC